MRSGGDSSNHPEDARVFLTQLGFWARLSWLRQKAGQTAFRLHLLQAVNQLDQTATGTPWSEQSLQILAARQHEEEDWRQ